MVAMGWGGCWLNWILRYVGFYSLPGFTRFGIWGRITSGMATEIELRDLLSEIRACHFCTDLPLGANPVLRASSTASILVVGQAPGIRVHETGIPWNDPSGIRLREWLGVTDDEFYDASTIAIIPMAFCYPGKGNSGDLPPPTVCSDLWRKRLHAALPGIQLTLLVGQYAQRYYLGKRAASVTHTVANWREFLPGYLPLPHPSPRNNIWLRKNPWFEDEVVRELQARVRRFID